MAVSRLRQNSYAALLAAIDAWEDDLGKARAGYSISGLCITDEEDARLREDERVARRAFGMVELLAPESVRGVCRLVLVRMTYFRILVTPEIGESNETDQSKKAGVNELYDRIQKAVQRLLQAVRVDLGVEDDFPSRPEEDANGGKATGAATTTPPG